MSDEAKNSEQYTQQFYEGQQAGSVESAKVIIPEVLRWVKASSVVDVGSGVGGWLRVFQENGVSEVLGIDGDWVQEDALLIDRKNFLKANLSKELKLERTFDLVVSMEVAEHLPSECAETFVQTLVNLGPRILFSAAVPHQGGVSHVNEQWSEYWQEKFEQKGYLAVDCIRHRVWNNPRVDHWYAQSALLFVHRDCLETDEALRTEFERQSSRPGSYVHPKLYLEAVQQRDELLAAIHSVRPGIVSPVRVLKALPSLIFHAIGKRMWARRGGA